MYEAFFQIERRPFAATPDVNCCYLSELHAAVFAELVRCLESGQGMSLLTGAAGTGKTLLCQTILSEFQRRWNCLFLATGQFASRRALLQTLLFELGRPYNGMGDQELRLELMTTLRNIQAGGGNTLLILDEAHLLGDKLLEEIRLMSDWAEQGQPLLRILLSGQPTLEETLASPGLSAFNQRLAGHVYLDPLTLAESIEYMEYRIRWAGGEPEEVFSPESLDLIARTSGGIPRCLNQLCDHSLLLAYVADIIPVNDATVREAFADLQQLPLHWNSSAMEVREPLADLELADAEVEELEPLTADACFEFGADAPAVEVDEVPEERTVVELPRPTLAVERPVIRTPRTTPVRGMSSWLADDLPAEEIVTDTYTALDAGRPVPVARHTPAPRMPTQALPSAAEQLADELLHTTPDRALELLEVTQEAIVAAQLDEAVPLETADDAGIAEFVSSKGIERTRAKSAPQLAETQVDWEAEIADSVIELGLELDHRVRGEHPETDPRPQVRETSATLRRTLDGIEHLTRFDVVEPDAAQADGARPSVVPRPNYKQLFSQLRRRQMQRDQ